MEYKDSMIKYHKTLDSLIASIKPLDTKLTKQEEEIYNNIDDDIKNLIEVELKRYNIRYNAVDIRTDFIKKAVVTIFKNIKLFSDAYDSGGKFATDIMKV